MSTISVTVEQTNHAFILAIVIYLTTMILKILRLKIINPI